MVSPAALSIILTTFKEGSDRNRALAVWGAIAGAGGAIGLLLGGVMVEALTWRWVFFINVPIGAALVALAPRIACRTSGFLGLVKYITIFPFSVRSPKAESSSV